MMNEAINAFAEQFRFVPVILPKPVRSYKRYVVAGMGGSHLAAGLLQSCSPALDIVIHRNYGLPANPGALKDALVIVSSYSGNTEEALDTFATARKKKLPVAVIAVGGALLELAKKTGVPYVALPNTGIQPRSALGFSFMALLSLTRQEKLAKDAAKLAKTLVPSAYEKQGKAIDEAIKGRVPIIYASEQNSAIAYNWKIKFNETGKIPAFCNVLPELNHNEMTGFDVKEQTAALSERMHFIMLRDKDDHSRIQKRMATLTSLFQDRHIPVTTIDLQGKTRLERIFSSLLIADWAAYHTAKRYGLEPEQVPMVEEFKRMIAS